jgi:hypothetical protein
MLLSPLLGQFIVIALVLGLVSWVAQHYLPEPFRRIVLVVCVVILIVWLLRLVGVWV